MNDQNTVDNVCMVLTVKEPNIHTGIPYLAGQSSPSFRSRRIRYITRQ